jgi:glycosyltransferase involved in cell wall biosynthesis
MTRKGSPVVPDVGILALVPERFDELWTVRHHVLSRLAQYFHVVWVNPADEWRKVRIRDRGRDARHMADDQAPGFSVYTPPFWLPTLCRPVQLARWSFRTRLTYARRVLAERGCRTIILSLWRPEFESALTSVQHDIVSYHIDDEYSFSSVEVPPDQCEMRLMAAADVVAVHSRGLLQNKMKTNPRTFFVPNGVDYEAYAAPSSEPADLAAIARPRIGYTGYLKSQLDWPLLLGLTTKRPEWSFVFVGPRRPHGEIDGALDELARRPNVYLLGAKPTQELAAYPQHFDVCMMPYRVDHYTNHIYPLKLHEYLASGRPAVGTRIRTLEDFADVVDLAGTPDEWSAAITRALRPTAESSDGHRIARQTVARQHDWQAITRTIAETLAQVLGSAVASRLVQAWPHDATPSPALQR